MQFLFAQLQSLQRASKSVFRRTSEGGLWAPVVALAVLKGTLLLGVTRVDLWPTPLVAALLEVAPESADSLHYRTVLLHLPALARWIDVGLFLTLGVVVQGWLAVRWGSVWTGMPLRLRAGRFGGLARLATLLSLALLLVGIPVAVRATAPWIGGAPARVAALVLGLGAQVVLFAAPAACILEGRGPWSSLKRSFAVVRALPLVVSFVVFVLAVLHVPGILARFAVLALVAPHDPGWIPWAFLATLPGEIVAVFLAAGFATRCVLSSAARAPLRGAV